MNAKEELPLDVMLKAMRWFSAMAGCYQPRDGNDEADEKKCAKYLKIATDIAIAVAPYQHPKMRERA